MYRMIHLQPDSLRFAPQLKNELRALADFEQPGFLKVTSKGFKRVSRIQALFQTLKGKLGFTNFCSASLVHYRARKLLYEIQVTDPEAFQPLIHRVRQNQTLAGQYQKLHTLFAEPIADLNSLKMDLIHDFKQLKPCYWKRVFCKKHHYNAQNFGFNAIHKPLKDESIQEGIGHFVRILRMNLSDEMIVQFFKPQFERYLRQKRIPGHLEATVASLQMNIAGAEFRMGKWNESAATHRLILESAAIATWPRALLERFFQQLTACNDHRHFLALYRKAILLDLLREARRAHFIQTATNYRTSPHEHKALLELAFNEASPAQVTSALAKKLLDTCVSDKEKLRTYFLLRQKAPHAVQDIDAPWAPFQTATEVRNCEAICITQEDRNDLNRVYRERSVQEAQSELKTSVKDVLLFRRGSKKEKALEKFRETFQCAKGAEYRTAWLSPYLELLSKKKELQKELKKVVSKILIICRTKNGTVDLLTLALPYTDIDMIAKHGANLGALLERSPLPKTEKLKLLEKILKQGPHPYLWFLKGEWLGDVKTKERLTAYRWAYTYAPKNLLDDSEPFYQRELLADDPVTLNDIPMYRQLALDAGCKGAL